MKALGIALLMTIFIFGCKQEKPCIYGYWEGQTQMPNTQNTCRIEVRYNEDGTGNLLIEDCINTCNPIGPNYNEYNFTYSTQNDLTIEIQGDVCVCGNCQTPSINSTSFPFTCNENILTVEMNNEIIIFSRL